ncbi:MAG: ATP-binding protein [Rhodosalinus sp.]|uniref:ATP-binding protein n=1 Tax=Rhodosalinus sp. TaxID=2047741 RepID=UPI003978FBD1
MVSLNLLAVVCLGYVAFLFAVAFAAERAAAAGRTAWLRSPWVYTLSLSIYCTAWTFYGAVGYAARSGLEFLTIYLGPTLVMVGWWWGLNKLVHIGRSQRITSIADLISSRYGKSSLLAATVTILAVVGTTPYIALQLQSVTLSVAAFAQPDPALPVPAHPSATAVWVAVGLAVFTILFGTRNLDANERHHGVVMAIAVEAVVKLFALLAVGVFVVWGIAGGAGAIVERIETSPELAAWRIDGARWTGLTLLAGAAFLCLPRMFQVMVVELEDERHLRTASWAFPLYVFLISLFVVPIALVGIETLPEGANPDLFVLTVPLAFGQEGLAFLAFLGGFSAATSMVIVAALALATMVSNHLVMPVWLRLARRGASVAGDVRHVVLLARRLSIAGVVFLGYLYYSLSGGGTALAAIGLIAFAGIAQVLPAMMGGLFWRGGSRAGALAGIGAGFGLWLYTLFLPSFGPDVVLSAALMAEGPLGIGWLRPYALFGIQGLDPLIHSALWSLSINTVLFLTVSLASFPEPLERLQGAQFVSALGAPGGARSWQGGAVQAEDLMVMAQRILGPGEALTLFRREAARQGLGGYLPEATPEFLEVLERELSGSVGAAAAHAMLAQMVGGMQVSVQDLLAVADETAQIMEYSARLEAKQEELTRTARQLREANEKLTRLSVQKDAFLGQISHELRTPMTSIRAFSEILRDMGEDRPLDRATQARYASVIHDEAIRLTRLLDDLLDLSVLENGQVSLNVSEGSLSDLLDHAVATAAAGDEGQALRVRRERGAERIRLVTDLDRLSQVFINLVSNARKYCAAPEPQLTIRTGAEGDWITVDFIDNGRGIPRDQHDVIFEKFARIGDQEAGGAGLGLAICREIMARLGGTIAYLPGQGGAAFRVRLPARAAMAAQ